MTVWTRIFAACAALTLMSGACKRSSARPHEPSSLSVTSPLSAGPVVAEPDASPKTTAPVARTPHCATQDCKTGKIIDDGCVSDGKGGKICASCVNMCP